MVPLTNRGLRAGIVRSQNQRSDENDNSHNAGAEGRASSGGSAIETAGRHAIQNKLIQVY